MKIEISFGRKKTNKTESNVASLKNRICKDRLSQLPIKKQVQPDLVQDREKGSFGKGVFLKGTTF